MNMNFSVAAGKYEDIDGGVEENCKFSDDFETLEQAMAAFEGVKSYPWARIELRDGDFIYEIEPTRIQRKVPGTERFEKCDFDGQPFIEDRELDDAEHAALTQAEVNAQINSLCDSGDYKMSKDSIYSILRALPQEIVREAMRMNGFAFHSFEDGCEALADLPIVMIRRDLNTAVRNLED